MSVEMVEGTETDGPTYASMSKPQSGRQGPLAPEVEQDAVVVVNPPEAPLVMTSDEADLSGIRMLDAAAKARTNADKGERHED